MAEEKTHRERQGELAKQYMADIYTQLQTIVGQQGKQAYNQPHNLEIKTPDGKTIKFQAELNTPTHRAGRGAGGQFDTDPQKQNVFVYMPDDFATQRAIHGPIYQQAAASITPAAAPVSSAPASVGVHKEQAPARTLSREEMGRIAKDHMEEIYDQLKAIVDQQGDQAYGQLHSVEVKGPDGQTVKLRAEMQADVEMKSENAFLFDVHRVERNIAVYSPNDWASHRLFHGPLYQQDVASLLKARAPAPSTSPEAAPVAATPVVPEAPVASAPVAPSPAVAPAAAAPVVPEAPVASAPVAPSPAVAPVAAAPCIPEVVVTSPAPEVPPVPAPKTEPAKPKEPFRLSEWLDGKGVEKKWEYSDRDLFNDLYDALSDEDKARFKDLKGLMDKDNTFIASADAIRAVKVGITAINQGNSRDVIAQTVLSALNEKSILVDHKGKVDDQSHYSKKEYMTVRDAALALEHSLSEEFKKAADHSTPQAPVMDMPLPPVKPAIPSGM